MSNRFCCTDPDIRLLAAGRVRFATRQALERAMTPLVERARTVPTGTLADVFRDVDTHALLFVAAWRVVRFEAAERTVVDRTGSRRSRARMGGRGCARGRLEIGPQRARLMPRARASAARKA